MNGPWTAQQIADAQAFLDGGNLGFWDIDLWIGGLAEAKAFGPTGVQGMLGTTFDFIFATQLIDLQNGDRFYYLARLGGTNILSEIEQSTFGDLFERGTGARHTNGDIFSTADEHVELSTWVSMSGRARSHPPSTGWKWWVARPSPTPSMPAAAMTPSGAKPATTPYGARRNRSPLRQ